MKYFKQWYDKSDKKEIIKSLVKSGQLNLVNGGWSAPDESITTYDDLLDNFLVGHRFI